MVTGSGYTAFCERYVRSYVTWPGRLSIADRCYLLTMFPYFAATLYVKPRIVLAVQRRMAGWKNEYRINEHRYGNSTIVRDAFFVFIGAAVVAATPAVMSSLTLTVSASIVQNVNVKRLKGGESESTTSCIRKNRILAEASVAFGSPNGDEDERFAELHIRQQTG